MQPSSDLAAVALGVTIDARDARDAPRLIRAIVPRAASAGMTPEEAARDHLAALAPLWVQRAHASDLATRSVQPLRGGASVVRLQQQVDGVDIHQGELRVMMYADGALAAVAGTMRASTGRASFRSTPSAALERALDALYGDARARPAITEGADRAGYRELAVADDPEVRVQTARARRELLAEGDRLIASWSVELLADRTDLGDDTVTSAARRYLIGDADGRVLREVDLTANDAFTYRAFADQTGTSNPFDGALESFNPHPTGAPDNTVPPPAPYDLVVMEAFNAPHDPWLAPDANTTSGNNVVAFARPTGLSPGDIFPDVHPGRMLDDRYDFTAEPLANQKQSKAAAVNVFFVTNWLHDWYYDSGFTEATGNAQAENLGRGGIPGDPLVARAQSSAQAGSRDNANMTVFDDGLSPIMNMFLWSGRGTTLLTTPTGTPSSAGFLAGPRFFDLTAGVVLTQDRTGGTHKACGRVTTSVAGKIALFEFDNTCNTATAIANLLRGGAIGVIAMMATPGAQAQILPGNSAANLPGVVIGFADGQALEAALPLTVTMHRTTTLEHDGDFDNAIISHEWGHYLHLRLASCETKQCAAMSEGWGDFTALHMMLRPTDDRAGTYGVGLYALTAGGIGSVGFGDPGYFGIRRFPYSRDQTRNGLGLRHISDGAGLPALPASGAPAAQPNSEVHNAGEVWAAMLWDAYNALLDVHPYADARRRMSDYVVAGLLLTPPDATFTEARDALLAAAGAADHADMLAMAAAFALRGAGTCAVAPDRASTSFGGVVESSILAAKLETSGITLTDDGVSCDHDGYLDPGESGILRLTLANSGIIAAEGIVVTATTTTPGVSIGKPIALASVAPGTHVDLEIPVKLAPSAPVSTPLDIAVRVDGIAGCDTTKLLVELHDRIGVDEKGEVGTTDNFETRLVGWTPTGTLAGAVWSRATDATGNHVMLGLDAPFTIDAQLVSPVLQVSATRPFVVTLRHAYSFQALPNFFFDGGAIELSDDGGATWRDVTKAGADPGYPAVISTDVVNVLVGRRVFSGTSAAFPAPGALSLDFGTQLAGKAVQLRFRIGTDGGAGAAGWLLDDVAVSGITNAPFPGFVPELTKCFDATTARALGDSRVAAVRGR